jgi:hypothetical protein
MWSITRWPPCLLSVHDLCDNEHVIPQRLQNHMAIVDVVLSWQEQQIAVDQSSLISHVLLVFLSPFLENWWERVSDDEAEKASGRLDILWAHSQGYMSTFTALAKLCSGPKLALVPSDYAHWVMVQDAIDPSSSLPTHPSVWKRASIFFLIPSRSLMI